MTRAWRIGEPDCLGYDIKQDERWGSIRDDDHIIGSALSTNLPSTPSRASSGSSHAGRVAAHQGAVRPHPPAGGAHPPFEDLSVRAGRPGRS